MDTKSLLPWLVVLALIYWFLPRKTKYRVKRYTRRQGRYVRRKTKNYVRSKREKYKDVERKMFVNHNLKQRLRGYKPDYYYHPKSDKVAEKGWIYAPEYENRNVWGKIRRKVGI